MKKWYRAISLLAIATLVAVAAGCGGSGEKKVVQPRPMSQTELVKFVSPGVVEVRDSQQRWGTGFIINKPEGLVVTAAHVTSGLASLKVRYIDQTVSARLLGTDPCNDTSLLQVQGLPAETKALKFGNSDTVKSGQVITVLGFPTTLQSSSQNEKLVSNQGKITADGTVEATPESWLPTYHKVIQHDAASTHGDSGGPVVNRFGKVVGMEVLGNPDAASQGYAVASSFIKSLLPDLKSGKNRAYIGISVEPPSARSDQEVKDMAWTYDPFDYGVAVFSVDPASPASDKLEFGDYIRNINGQEVNSMSDLCDILVTNQGKQIDINGNFMTDDIKNDDGTSKGGETWTVRVKVQ